MLYQYNNKSIDNKDIDVIIRKFKIIYQDYIEIRFCKKDAERMRLTKDAFI